MQLFDRLRNEQHGFESKVVAVNGELTEPYLGMSQQDRDAMATE